MPFSLKSQQEAFMAILYCGANVDDEVDDLELLKIAQVTSKKRMFKVEKIDGLLSVAMAFYKKHGRDLTLQAAAEKLEENERKSAYVCVIDIIYVSGDVTNHERDLLHDLAVFLGIDNTWAETAINVIALKYL